ncbi:hypothetical protein ACOMHN_062418 [Nucella lapillus]
MASAEEEPLPNSPQMPQDSGSNATQGTTENQTVSAVFGNFQDLLDKTYTVVQKALDADEGGDLGSALHNYNCSLPLMEKILATKWESWISISAAEKETARHMQLKMNQTNLQVLSRLEALRGLGQAVSLSDTSVSLEGAKPQVASCPEMSQDADKASSLSDTSQEGAKPQIASCPEMSQDADKASSLSDTSQEGSKPQIASCPEMSQDADKASSLSDTSQEGAKPQIASCPEMSQDPDKASSLSDTSQEGSKPQIASCPEMSQDADKASSLSDTSQEGSKPQIASCPEMSQDADKASSLSDTSQEGEKLQVTSHPELSQDPDQASSLPDTSLEGSGEGVRLPSYEEAVSSGPTSLVLETGAGNTTAMSGSHTRPAGGRCSMEGTELFCLADGVKMFYFNSRGETTELSEPTSLHIIRLEDWVEESEEREEGGAQGGGVDRVFLQVGDWVYPLVRGASPILRGPSRVYLFPDLTADGTGKAVGLIVPDLADKEELHVLDDILRNFALVKDQRVEMLEDVPRDPPTPTAPGSEAEGAGAGATAAEAGSEVKDEAPLGCGGVDQSTSAMISRGILTASSWISWGVEKGAEKAGEWINYGSSKLREQLQPEQMPRSVDCRLQQGAVYARKATNTAVSVSAFVVTKLGEATVSLGRQVAPRIRKKGGELLPESVKTEENKSRLHGVMDVASSGLRGFGTVWLSLERAAKVVGRSMATETVATVQHKYGEEAGKLAENTVYAAGNVAMTAYTAESLAVKAIVKRTARDTGSAMVNKVQENTEDGSSTAAKELEKTNGDGSTTAAKELAENSGGGSSLMQELQENIKTGFALVKELRKNSETGSAMAQELQKNGETGSPMAQELQKNGETGFAMAQELQKNGETGFAMAQELQKNGETGSAMAQELQKNGETGSAMAQELQKNSETGSAVMHELQENSEKPEAGDPSTETGDDGNEAEKKLREEEKEKPPM